RRRHTSFSREWSSDVCSSDLRRPHRSRGSAASPQQALAGSSFGTRLFLALTVVVVGCAVSAWLVASALAPGIFHDHLGQAGIDRSEERRGGKESSSLWHMDYT